MAGTGPPRTAVCVLRVENQAGGRFLITVTTTLDISASQQACVQSVGEFDDALSLVASFLQEYERGENPGTRAP